MSSTKQDYYKVLELEKGASAEEIRLAKNRLAKKYHPDKNLDKKEEAEAKFKELQEAYEVLSNPEKKELYDKFGHDGLKQQNQPDPFSGDTMHNFMNNIFGNMFGQQHQQQDDSVPNVACLHELTLEDLYTGKTVTKKINRHSLCKKCNGYGTSDGKEHKCQKCNGVGAVIKVIRMGPIVQQMHEQCQMCSGTGRERDAKNCTACNGNCAVMESVQIEFKVPAGFLAGNKIEIPFMGNEIPLNERKNGKARSNVEIHIKQTGETTYKRMFVIQGKKPVADPADLLCEMQLTLEESLCGFQVSINHIDGKKLVVESDGCIKHGDILIVTGKGMPVLGNKTGKQFGDLYIAVTISYPQKLDLTTRANVWKALTNTNFKEPNKNMESHKLKRC